MAHVQRHREPRRVVPTRLTRPTRPQFDALEARQLLAISSGFNPIADFSGATPQQGGQTALTMNISPLDFNMPAHRVLLGFAIQASGSGMGMGLSSIGGTPVRILSQTGPAAGGASEVMLAKVGPGAVSMQMSSPPGSQESFQVDVFLAGDANGDHQVNRTDLGLIRSLLGAQSGRPGYTVAADADGDGRITMRDLALAQQNLGAATSLHPLSVSLTVDPASDPDQNGVITSSNIKLDGHTSPGAIVLLDQGANGSLDQATLANAQGNYQFIVSPPIGQIPFKVIAVDRFGQIAVSQINVRHADVVIAWDQTMLDAIRADKTSLGLTTRTTAMVSAAVYDAVNDIERIGSVYEINVPAPAGASVPAAASAAAYGILLGIYPQQKARFDATLAESLATLPAGPGLNAGIAVGLQVAQGMLALRQNDGSNLAVPYTPGDQPGQWRPTPPDFSAPWGPEWGSVTPFAIPSAQPFLPPPPPPLNSLAYTLAFNQAKSLGALNSTTRTPQQTETGHFWAYDITGLGPPPIMYNEIAQTIALQQGNTLEQNARLFALANIAMADTGMVAWDTKFTDNFWRPVTAIPLASTDGNPATIADPSWVPLGAPGDGTRADFTPPFPAYISGHASFGGALFQILADFYGTDNIHFKIGSDELPGVYHSFNSFSAAAQENAISRIYLGIHWSFDAIQGVNVGDNVANYVFQHVLTPT